MRKMQVMPESTRLVENAFNHPDWMRWFREVFNNINRAPKLFSRTNTGWSLVDQEASIDYTALPIQNLTQGLYRVSYYLRITQAATTSSSAEVTLRWTDGGVTPTFTGAAVNGNTTTSYQSGSVVLHADDISSIEYRVTYASVGATPMRYRLEILVEEL